MYNVAVNAKVCKVKKKRKTTKTSASLAVPVSLLELLKYKACDQLVTKQSKAKQNQTKQKPTHKNSPKWMKIMDKRLNPISNANIALT